MSRFAIANIWVVVSFVLFAIVLITTSMTSKGYEFTEVETVLFGTICPFAYGVSLGQLWLRAAGVIGHDR